MTQTHVDVDGINVFIEGEGEETLLMIHGWPDTHRLWDSTVEALKTDYRCVRFTLPGFELAKPPYTPSLEQITATILRVADAVSPNQKVTLILHDWGCIFGYEFSAQHADRVAKIVAVDIGDYNTPAFANSLTTSAKLQIFGYQFWLAVAWKLGSFGAEKLANAMTRFMAGKMRCPNPPEAITWQLNYPYAMRWFGLQGGLSRTIPVAPKVPLLYIYGALKPFMFHSADWLQDLSIQAGSETRDFATGHWVMVQAPEPFNACIAKWLTYK
jgi:pimeloyl-ACP methyl ester carboxylesterase